MGLSQACPNKMHYSLREQLCYIALPHTLQVMVQSATLDKVSVRSWLSFYWAILIHSYKLAKEVCIMQFGTRKIGIKCYLCYYTPKQ